MKNPELSHDVVVEILARLPVKTLLMFKTVCSLWHKTIESPHFVKLQACSNQESEEKVLLLDSSASNFYVADINTLSVRKIVHGFEFETKTREIYVYSSNGVLLLVDRRNGRMVLWNPATGKHRHIPSPPNGVAEYSYFYGLWYDSCNEFRILVIRDARKVLVWDSNSNSWKTVDPLPSNVYFINDQYNSKAFIDGGFHLAAWVSDNNRNDRILSLSPEGKVIRDFRPPLNWNKPRHGTLSFFLTTKVWEGRQCLQALAKIWTYTSVCFECWNMEEYGKPESWKKVCSLEHYDYRLHSLQQSGRQLWVNNSDLSKICIKDGDGDEMKSIISSSESMSYVGTYTYTPTLLSPES